MKLRFGMVGGGEGAFIGPVHRMAAELDGMAELVCGAFSSDPQRSQRSGQQLYHLPVERCYDSYAQLFAQEARMPAGKRMQFVVIATPNHLHFPVASAALQAGFHVVCDKPLTRDVTEAVALQALVEKTGCNFALTHNYTGYPMVREARELVLSGALGRIRRVSCEYLQGWLANDLPDNKQAAWRTDPAQAGAAGCFGDIGSHGQNLMEFVSGQTVASVCADLSRFVPGRALDDDGNVLVRLDNGARGILSASQIAVGKENDLQIQVFGERGGLQWAQSDANSLIVRWLDRPYEVRRTGGSGTSMASMAATRIPAGHPEGYLEAFAAIYRNFCLHLNGQTHHGFPTVADGVRGMQFLAAVVASDAQDSAWCDVESTPP